MNWFYAEGSQQKGPVSDNDLAALLREGAIKPETLLWREGQPDWQPLSRLRPDLLAGSGAPVLGGVVVGGQGKDLLVQQMREGAMSPQTNPYGLRYAGFWIRVAAKLIDGIVAMVVTVPVMALLAGGAGLFSQDFVEKMNNDDPEAMGAFLAFYAGILLTSVLFQLLYNSIMVWKWGGTVGKLAVGVKVVTVESQPLSFGRAFGRAAADMINNFICNGLTYLMVAFDEPEKRGLHDHICSTRVVYK